MKLLVHGMKVVERVIEKRLCRIVSVDEMHFSFMPKRGTIDAVFILRMIQEEYHAKGKKLYMCFVDLMKAFDRVPRKVFQWALRKKEIPVVLVRSVMSLYREQIQGLEWILSCYRSLRLKWGCTNDLCCHCLFLQWWKM